MVHLLWPLYSGLLSPFVYCILVSFLGMCCFGYPINELLHSSVLNGFYLPWFSMFFNCFLEVDCSSNPTFHAHFLYDWMTTSVFDVSARQLLIGSRHDSAQILTNIVSVLNVTFWFQQSRHLVTLMRPFDSPNMFPLSSEVCLRVKTWTLPSWSLLRWTGCLTISKEGHFLVCVYRLSHSRLDSVRPLHLFVSFWTLSHLVSLMEQLAS